MTTIGRLVASPSSGGTPHPRRRTGRPPGRRQPPAIAWFFSFRPTRRRYVMTTARGTSQHQTTTRKNQERFCHTQPFARVCQRLCHTSSVDQPLPTPPPLPASARVTHRPHLFKNEPFSIEMPMYRHPTDRHAHEIEMCFSKTGIRTSIGRLMIFHGKIPLFYLHVYILHTVITTRVDLYLYTRRTSESD